MSCLYLDHKLHLSDFPSEHTGSVLVESYQLKEAIGTEELDAAERDDVKVETLVRCSDLDLSTFLLVIRNRIVRCQVERI